MVSLATCILKMTYKKWQKDQLWNNSQSARNKLLHLFRVKMYCRVFTSVLIVLVFASFSPVLFEYLGLQLFLFDNAWCGAILALVWFHFFVLLFAIHCFIILSRILRADWLTEVYYWHVTHHFQFFSRIDDIFLFSDVL